MYQCYVVQNFSGTPYNIILGKDFATKDDAYEMAQFWSSQFGKVDAVVVEPSGTPIKTVEQPKYTLKNLFDDIVRLIAGV